MRNLLAGILLCSGFAAFSQSSPDADIKLKALTEKNAEYHRKTDGEVDGYRIKIHFGIDRTVMNTVKQKFTAKYSDIPAYEDYKQPNWVVVVGNFKTRVEAFEVFKKIQPEYPNAFIVKSKVKPSKL
ncbi:MAG: SPOR domain-containing protein [Bacteroidia bacterium]